jgi:hypothetical protein
MVSCFFLFQGKALLVDPGVLLEYLDQVIIGLALCSFLVSSDLLVFGLIEDTLVEGGGDWLRGWVHLPRP